MSYTEVTVLRKGGHIDEAIQMAESDLSLQCDYWTLSALFWCLNDLYKTQPIEKKEQTVSRMIEIAQKIGENNEIVAKCLEKAKFSITPHYAAIVAASERAKQDGMAYNSYKEISSIYAKGELPSSLFYDYGWVIYRALHQNPQLDIGKRKVLLNNYLKLNLPTPSLLHSLILGEAVNIEKAQPLQFLFSTFLNMWDLKNLREEDWKRGKTKEGQSFPSLVEKMISVYVKEMMITPQVTPSDDFVKVLEMAVLKWPKDENLLRNKAQICKKLGQIEDSIKLYMKIIQLSPDKSYLWAELAEMVDDDELKTALLCKALQTNSKPEFLGKRRIALAQILIRKEEYEWAKSELAEVEKLYKQQEWKLPLEWETAAKKIPPKTNAANARTLYTAYTSKADNYLFSDLPSVLMVKLKQQTNTITTQTKKQKKVLFWILVDENGKTEKIKPTRFGLSLATLNGQCFNAKKQDNHIVHMEPLEEIPKVEWIKNIQGSIRIKTKPDGKRFGFVEDCYIHNELLNNIDTKKDISGIAIRIEGKWQCVHIEQ